MLELRIIVQDETEGRRKEVISKAFEIDKTFYVKNEKGGFDEVVGIMVSDSDNETN